ncbi:UDP-4-amino-4,6-dideoxy-N-acetyl-beta-L-altrosamine N-acetyltransferase [Candidatus Bipolaricaulota bacterium]|nr:UDP-4-amino-4,6-dideoxy-N-acetyl-beta-L-altrosamine N-acetyltransferase [Candidatus Bipolaricaulota bacterium]
MTTLRDIQPDDKDMIRNWHNLPEVAKWMYADHYICAEEHEQWFQDIFSDPSRQYWIIMYGQEDVGLVNLYDIDYRNKRCYWAFYVANPNVRGKGVGSFVEYSILSHVFDELEFNRLCCEVLASNQLVVEMHKSFGFVQEGHFRQHVIKGGQPIDVVFLAILKEEWESKRIKIKQRLNKKRVALPVEEGHKM